MFPWMMPSATMGGSLSLLSLLSGNAAQGQQGGSQYGNSPFAGLSGTLGPMSFFANQAPAQTGDRSDQNGRGNQPDRGNTMAPPGQQPQGGPDDNQMAPYDPNTVSPGYGWSAPSWMRAFAGGGRVYPRAGGGSMMSDPRMALRMGMLGLNMMQPRRYF